MCFFLKSYKLKFKRISMYNSINITSQIVEWKKSYTQTLIDLDLENKLLLLIIYRRCERYWIQNKNLNSTIWCPNNLNTNISVQIP